jgi:transcriptional antiterminator NusG
MAEQPFAEMQTEPGDQEADAVESVATELDADVEEPSAEGTSIMTGQPLAEMQTEPGDQEADAVESVATELDADVEEPSAEGTSIMTEQPLAEMQTEQDDQEMDAVESVADEQDLDALEPSAEDEVATTEPEGDADESTDGRKWYVVHCYSGYENKVKRNLEQRISSMEMENYIFQVVVPTEEEIEVREGKRRTYQRRVFPGYILVEMTMTDDSWYVVRNTPGVTGFVGMGTKPTPLREEEVQRIIQRMEAEAPKVKVTFKQGQRVRIVQGPFADFIGTVDDINMEKGKVRVMVSFFGRETPVELDFLQVEKA